MKRIFYFNITYSCNSNCVFCYSHNTRHNILHHNEISTDRLVSYLSNHQLCSNDRVIINGGEPLLHRDINEILEWLKHIGCEVLVYTNGRLLTQLNLKSLTDRFRFIVPVHGHEMLHDRITGRLGSYSETVNGMLCFKGSTDALLDLKIIINSGMLENSAEREYTLSALNNVFFNHAVHITKMANTQVSERNKCQVVSNIEASKFTKLLVDMFMGRHVPIKIYDTCIQELSYVVPGNIVKYSDDLTVFFCDYNQDRFIPLSKPEQPCRAQCPKAHFCLSAVSEYKVLELYGENVYENLE